MRHSMFPRMLRGPHADRVDSVPAGRLTRALMARACPPGVDDRHGTVVAVAPAR